MNMPLVLSLAASPEPIVGDDLALLIREARRGLRNCCVDEDAKPVAKRAGHPIVENKGPAHIKLVRLDYRLLHGQVVFSWINYVGAQRVIVVDNDAATDPIKQNALKLAKPSGIRLNIFTVERALSKMAKLNTLGENVMFVFGNVHELATFCASYRFDEINFGAAANHDGARPVGGKDTSVFMDEAELACARKLLDLGIKIYEQQTPKQPRTDIGAL